MAAAFCVEGDGQVGVPGIVQAAARGFAAATLEALRRWRNEPALRKDRHTIYADTRAFDFSRR